MGASTSGALSAGLATGVSTDLTYGVVRYDIDWGDGTVTPEFNLVDELVYADHTYAHAGAHTITIKATGPGGETAVTTKTMVVEGSEFTPHAPPPGCWTPVTAPVPGPPAAAPSEPTARPA